MGAGVRDAFPPPTCCVVVFIHLRMETPLCGRSGGHTGTAPTVSLGGLRVGSFVCWLVKTVHMNQHHRCCTFDSPGLIERSEIYPG